MDTTNIIEVWTNRWNKDNRACLVASWRVMPGRNKIVLTESPNELPYYMFDHEIRKYPIESKKSKAGSYNDFYAIPVSECRRYTTPFDERDAAPVRAQETEVKQMMRITEPEEQEIKQLGLL